ncbi:hypothetical protein INT43_008283 [Umbelopsis isabellina]|uniref:Uncharacterized protein n=1 Tax=Mortierella isabellina TaxID=91625 RepID=A0A8H7PCW2_MORIS|nr:hypothetical protein INT43_008283 [Umbelopsis isabellina]
MEAVESYLENDPNYRFIAVGPSSAAGVMVAAFFLLLLAFIYNAIRYRGFLRFSIVRINLFCAILTAGYILRIVCNIKLNNPAPTSADVSQFLTIYIAASALTAVGNFVLFLAILSILNNWVSMKRQILERPEMPRERRFNIAIILLTVAALALTIAGSATNNNTLRIIGNAIFLFLIFYLLIVVRYYHRVFADSPESTAQTSKPSSWTSHTYAVQATLAFCLIVLLAAQAFKLAQSVAPVSSPALKSIALVYIFGPIPDLIILIVLAITWGPVFHKNIYTKMAEWRTTQLPMAQNSA